MGHRISTTSIIIVLAIGGYYTYKHYTNTSGETRYVLGRARMGNIQTTVSGTGYVSSENQIDIKSKVSGNITYVGVKAGDKVREGQLIAQVDSRDAALALESAKIAYDKLVEPAKQTDLKEAQDSVNKSYNDAWNAVSGTFLDMPTIASGLKALLYSQNGYLNEEQMYTLGDLALSYRNQTGLSYDKAEALYESAIIEYKSLSRLSNQDNIDTLVNDTLAMLKATADALKNARNTVNYINTEYPTYNTASESTVSSNINSWSDEINTDLSNLVSAQNSVTVEKNALDKLQEGADTLDIASQKVALQEKQNTYNDYFIRAPFDGVIARVGVKVGEEANGAVIATIVGNKNIAEIPLNEIDAANVKVGEKVNLTFDAAPGLNIVGDVDEVDLVGEVSQGVVTYNIKISFNSNPVVKSGMSVSADIITDEKDNILVVPSSAVKTRGNAHYVEEQRGASTTPPVEVPVEIGISNDTETEILSGLKAGDVIVVRTIAPSTATQTSSAPSLFGGGGSSGNVRFGGSGATRTGTTGR